MGLEAIQTNATSVAMRDPIRARDAVIDPTGRYRYRLTRTWDPSLPVVVWIMLNPSTADATQDDATIRRCTDFALRWYCGGIVVVNLFAFRSTDPRELKRHASLHIIGHENDQHVLAACTAENVRHIVAAWGNHGSMHTRDISILRKLAEAHVIVECLGQTSSGLPKHPVRLAANTPLRPLIL